MRLLGVGTPKAARLVRLAGWAPPEPGPAAADRTRSHPGRLHLVTDPETRSPQTMTKTTRTTDVALDSGSTHDQQPRRHLTRRYSHRPPSEPATRLQSVSGLSEHKLQEQYTPRHHDPMGRRPPSAAGAGGVR